jgi:hypothetical protein
VTDDDVPEDAPGGLSNPVRRSQEDWQAVRRFLNTSRYELSLTAQDLYPPAWRVAGTPLLARPGWLPAAPVPLDQVTLTWRGDPPPPVPVDGTAAEFATVLPLRDDSSRMRCYSEALGALDRPRLFEDRSCYRLLDAAASGRDAELAFGAGRYFDMVNVCEAAAHEYAAVAMAPGGLGRTPTQDELPLRTLIGDPADLSRRRVMVAVCTLVLRADRASGHTAMLLHWRDPARVASGGGLYQVAPVGVFQPSHDAGWNQANDFDLWRSIVRELSEELLGTAEDYRSHLAPIDYEHWPLYAGLTKARQAGTLRVYWLGLGVDPLSLAADMLTVAVLDAAVFDAVFAGLVTTNDEGHLVAGRGQARPENGVAFNPENIERFAGREPMQAAGSALLRIAWAHREALLG